MAKTKGGFSRLASAPPVEDDNFVDDAPTEIPAQESEVKAETKAKPKKSRKNTDTEAEAVTEKVTTTAVAAPKRRFALAAPNVGGGSALMAAVDDPDDDWGGSSLPSIALKGGSNGGVFAPRSSLSESVQEAIEEATGRKKIQAIYLSHRICVTSNPHDFDDKQDDDRPLWSAACPDNNIEFYRLLRKACKKYKFTAKVDRADIYDGDADLEIGHIKPHLELLVFIPGLAFPDEEGIVDEDAVGDIVVVKSPYQFDSFHNSMRSLQKLMDPAQGIVPVMPITIGVDLEEGKGSVAYSIYSLALSARRAGDGEEDQFNTFMEDLEADDDRMEQLGEWVEGYGTTDDKVLVALNKAAQL
jgi:hypothetical protein